MSGASKFLFPALAAISAGLSSAGQPATGRILAWEKSETKLALLNHGNTVWCLVMDPARPKSFFHPLATVHGEVLTAFEPADHHWHRGLWWSWKFINGVNYWEEDPKTGHSAGLSKLIRTDVQTSGDFSARVRLDFHYQLPGGDPVLIEQRNLHVSPPDAEGTYVIDWKSTFTAGNAPVKLDRTPPAHLGGPGYGGYAGLSLRMAQGLDGYTFRTSGGETTPAASHGKNATWVDLAGPKPGIAIFDHTANFRHPCPWYLHSDKTMTFFSPSLLFNQPLELAAGKSISLSYQVIVHSQALPAGKLEERWRAFTQPEPAKP